MSHGIFAFRVIFRENFRFFESFRENIRESFAKTFVIETFRTLLREKRKQIFAKIRKREFSFQPHSTYNGENEPLK
jgi:hypothetical protein